MSSFLWFSHRALRTLEQLAMVLALQMCFVDSPEVGDEIFSFF